ncbi:MAG TPA: hypothetical protein VFA34_05500 [Actinomycetota bacterium]|jgi:hypothetical protein|nr:hypothetical protein [Actinomycetota bacterium]
MLLAAAPQLLDSPCCDVINRVPWGFFMLVHVAIFALAVVFALRLLQGGHELFGWGFAIFALAEVSYMTYHVNITLFLFAHTISEVLVLAGLGTLFAGFVRHGLVSTHDPDATDVRPRTRRAVAR